MPDYFKHAQLARAGDLLPWHGRMFGRGTDVEGYEIVDLRDSFTLWLIGNGSIVLAEPPATPAAATPAAATPAAATPA